MTHDEALHLLSARVDGELTPDQEQALDAWLRDHPDGKILAEAFHAQDADMRSAFEPRREAAALTAERVADRLPAPPMPVSSTVPSAAPISHSRWRHVWSVVPPVAAAALLASVLLLFGMRQPDSPPTLSD